MRNIGHVTDPRVAKRFVDYLLTIGIEAKWLSGSDKISIWVCHEDDVARARTDFLEFIHSPEDRRFQNRRMAYVLRRKAKAEQVDAKDRMVDVRATWYDSPRASLGQITLALIVLSVLVFIGMTWVGETNDTFRQGLLIASQNGPQVQSAWLDASFYSLAGLSEIFQQGQVWRLFTPILIHYGFVHILFNMMWLRELGSEIENRSGSLRLLGMVVLISIITNFGQYMVSGTGAGGMSGVVYGLFGYVWFKQKFHRSSGYRIEKSTVVIMLVWLVICMTGWIGPIANTAHVLGLLCGMILGCSGFFVRKLVQWLGVRHVKK